MPTLSMYIFERNAPSDAGRFWQNHVGHPPGGWAWSTIYGLPAVHSSLAWERPDSEDVLDLSGAANNPLALSVIDGLLSGGASRSGPVRTSYITWANVPAGVKGGTPGRHQPWELLGTLNIDFHVSTPWYCSDANGTITYYVFFYLDGGGVLHAYVEGWRYRYDGGGPFCTGAINSALNSAVPGGMSTVQSQLDLGLSLFAAGRRFSMLYFLPGRGVRSGGSFQDNADNNVALAVLPR
jgi:hypothetical protein